MRSLLSATLLVVSATLIGIVMTSGFVVAQSEHMVMHGDGFQSAGAIRLEMGGPEDMKQVKGIPLSADIVNTHVQNLADGNKITNEETSHFYRDSEGRTRRENKLVMPGREGSNVPTMIMINDPVAHTRFVLNTGRKSADELPGHPMHAESDVMYMKKHVDEARATGADGATEKKEDLGTQTIEGYVARGTRSSHVIPAGQIGNEKPITVTTESWYSDELGMEVLRVHNDPWSGEVTTKVTNVRRGEQEPSLFTPPADYKVEKMDGNRVIRIEKQEIKTAPEN